MATEEERLGAVVEGLEALEGRLAIQEGVKRVYAELAEKKIMSYRMVKVPKDYYDLTMEQRSQCLAPCSVPQMCKSIVFENVSWDGDKSLPIEQQMADVSNSRYYLLVVQYNAKFSADKLRLFVTGLRPANDPSRLTRSRCNFQLAANGEDLTGPGFAWDYPNASSWEARQVIWQRYESYIKGHLWFLKSDPTVSATIRDAMRQWGWPKDEFEATGHFPHAMYIREARRLVGAVVMTQHDAATGHNLSKNESVGLGSYDYDSHYAQRVPCSCGGHERSGSSYYYGVQEEGGIPHGGRSMFQVPRAGMKPSSFWAPFYVFIKNRTFAMARQTRDKRTGKTQNKGAFSRSDRAQAGRV